jgi:hypothetical protein
VVSPRGAGQGRLVWTADARKSSRGCHGKAGLDRLPTRASRCVDATARNSHVGGGMDHRRRCHVLSSRLEGMQTRGNLGDSP